MSPHVPDALLRSFVLGDVDESLAVQVALHLDACPACATRAAGLEPLASAFAAVDDPLPPDLTAPVLSALQRPERRLVPELLVGGGFLGGAALLLAVLGQPLAVLARVGLLFDVTESVARALASGLGAMPGLLAATWVALLLGGLATALLVEPRHLGARDDRAGGLR